jgi:hypothetical protein
MKKYIKRKGDLVSKYDFDGLSTYGRYMNPLKRTITYLGNGLTIPHIKKDEKYNIKLINNVFLVNNDNLIEDFSYSLLIKVEGYYYYINEEDLKYFSIGKHLLIEKVGGFAY